jgi:hypothetical protein
VTASPLNLKQPTDKNPPVIFEEEFEENIMQIDPDQKARSYYWKTAIGL